MSDASEALRFIDHRLPTLPSGAYRVDVEQAVHVSGQLEQPRAGVEFMVRSERFELEAAAVHTRFPPANASGPYDRVLPHIMVARPSWPWARRSSESELDPWLALVVLDETEDARVVTRRVGCSELRDFDKWKEPGDVERTCQIVEVPTEMIDELLPPVSALRWLAHVRRVSGSDKHDVGAKSESLEYAIVFGHRLPTPGKKHTVHLVSLEDFYRPNRPERYADHGGRVQLVSLHQWRFTCEAQSQRTGAAFKLAVQALSPGPLRRASDRSNEELAQLVDQGYVLTRHRLRGGATTAALYRGPLLPHRPIQSTTPTLLTSADRAWRYREDLGLFDLSYAAAWQLGRTLTWSDEQRAMAMLDQGRAKRRRALLECQRQRELEQFHTRVCSKPSADEPSAAASEFDQEWLGQLASLSRVPLSYLVAQPDMLPPETLRFFHVDREWIDALVDGALGIGRKSLRDDEADAAELVALREAQWRGLAAMRNGNAPAPTAALTGVLIRSRVVLDWPGLELAGFADGNDDAALRMLTFQRRGDEVCLVVFDGELRRLRLSQPTETPAFVVQSEVSGRVIDIGKLTRGIASPAHFAHSMIERAAAVDFTREG